MSMSQKEAKKLLRVKEIKEPWQLNAMCDSWLDPESIFKKNPDKTLLEQLEKF